ncbi:tetratricopeptide repeat protein [Streptomyces sp. NA04227]|uniref:tetratricopeptide repeat protein n=1 Tax=Streptomyces sp. NA04227 TaxID=2742136 RepID=UPI0015916FD1|nr:tetratricopeptide repeat protein [Streptomyces sp. NA04227]QKW09426.1 tetratricopeptide repeat protein [Streptomyces sp. NA04227]
MTQLSDGAVDFDGLRAAIAENDEQPEGPARNARAEELLAQAEQLGIPLAVVEALGHQLQSYNYSSEKDKMFVPFARLLRMWDERPDDFDTYEAHSLHWVFKWMSSGMLEQPHIPLASIEKWLGEMEHRYRLAGYSERAVRCCEHAVAHHIGDLARAERAYQAWLAAERDDMADCHACELHEQGAWKARLGDDAAALELWQPVLAGTYTCAHEPHAVLASSLLPLLRENRRDEARAHHLRGLRLVRGMESMRDAYADHVEFCALTGNEARALELLAERPAYFVSDGDPASRMEFLAVVARLMDRLVELGLGAQPVPGPPGREWRADALGAHARDGALELAALFDARNGTAHIGERVRARMAREPLAERLALGVRAGRPVTPPRPAPPAHRSEAPTDDLPALLDAARTATEELRPESVSAWAAVARAATEQDAVLDAVDLARLAEHRGLDGRTPREEAVRHFEEAAERYEEAGDGGEAEASRARAAHALAHFGSPVRALADVDTCREKVLTLYGAGDTGPRQAGAVLAARLRILLAAVQERMGEAAPETDPAANAQADPGGAADTTEPPLAAAESAARELLAHAASHTEDLQLAARSAEARGALGELAEHRGEFGEAADGYARAAEEYVAASLPWFAVEYEVRLTDVRYRLCDREGALAAGYAALEHGAGRLPPPALARVHLRLADLLGARGELADAVTHALDAAHWADEAGESGTFGAWARHKLGGFLLHQGRAAEAAEVLEGALAEISTEIHGEGTVVQTRWWLGESLSALGEHRLAAEHWLRAAETAATWPDQSDHAALAHLAAEALSRSELPEQADRAYGRAGELWQELGNPHGLVRSLRARAWLAQELGEPARARELMTTALHTTESALAAAPEEGEDRDRLALEHADTLRQLGELLPRITQGDPARDTDGHARTAYEEALALLDRAVAGFAPLGAAARDRRSAAEIEAGWLAHHLGRPEEAAARAERVRAEYADEDSAVAARHRGQAAELSTAVRQLSQEAVPSEGR